MIAPADPGWVATKPFMVGSAPVLTLDFSSHNYLDAHAQAMANSLARHLGMGLSSGPVNLSLPTVPIHPNAGGGTKPVPYIRGGDFIECQQSSAGPLYITRAHVVANTGYVDMDVGLAADALILQLEAAGAISPVTLHKPYHKKKAPPAQMRRRGR